MQPDNLLVVRSGLFDTECLVDCTDNGSEIGRMIILNRWLRILHPHTAIPQTIAHEPDMAELPYRRRTIDSPDMNAAATGHAILSIKTGTEMLNEQRKFSGKITEMEI